MFRLASRPAAEALTSLRTSAVRTRGIPLPVAVSTFTGEAVTVLASRPTASMLASRTTSTMLGGRAFFSSLQSRSITTSPRVFAPFQTFPPPSAKAPLVHTFFHEPTQTWTYVVVDPGSNKSFVIDPVLDYDPASGRVSFKSVEDLTDFIVKQGYEVERIIETHVHADHLTGAHALKKMLPNRPPVYVGDQVHKAQSHFAPIFGFTPQEMEHSFDGLMADGETIKLGDLTSKFIHMPGHTPEHMGILVGDALFAGDSLFMPDVGTARVDFPGGNANMLFDSIVKAYALGDDVRVFTGHDYPPKERATLSMAPISEHKATNKHMTADTTREEFVKVRTERDALLGAPRLLYASLQVNIRGGRLPPPDQKGQVWLRTPVRLPERSDLISWMNEAGV